MKSVRSAGEQFRLSGNGASDTAFLKSISGREVKAVVIRGAEPGQTALLRISGRILQAAAENTSLVKDSVLYIKTSQSEGRFIMKILAKEEPVLFSAGKMQESPAAAGNTKKEIIKNQSNNEAMDRFFSIAAEEAGRISESGSKTEIQNLKEKAPEMLLSLLHESLPRDITEKTDPQGNGTGREIFSAYFRTGLENLGTVAGLLLSAGNSEFRTASVLLMGSEKLKEEVEADKHRWMERFRKWELNVTSLEVVSVKETRPEADGPFIITV